MTLSSTELDDLVGAVDRYPVYKDLRDNQPVLPVEVNGHEAYLLTRYADVSRVLKTASARVQPRAGEFPAHIGTGPASSSTDSPCRRWMRPHTRA